MDATIRPKKRYAYLVLGTLVTLFLGLTYAWSIFSTSFSSEFGWGRESLRLVFTISCITLVAGQLLGARLCKIISMRTCGLIGALCMCGGFVLTVLGLDLVPSLAVLYCCYGALIGFGSGMVYNVAVSNVNMWFPEKIGFSTGVLLMGFGFGTLLLGTVAGKLIDFYGWRPVFLGLAIYGFLIMVVTILVVKPAPQNEKGEVVGDTRKAPFEGMPILKTKVFWFYSLWATCAICAGLTLIGDAKQGALAVGIDADLATLLVGLVSAVNGCVRIIVGLVYDRANLAAAMSMNGVFALMASILLAVSFLPGHPRPQMYLVAALIMGFAYGCVPVIASSFTRECFGLTDYPTNFSIVNLNMCVGSLLSSVAAGTARSIGGAVWGDFAVYVGAVILVLISCAAIILVNTAIKRAR